MQPLMQGLFRSFLFAPSSTNTPTHFNTTTTPTIDTVTRTPPPTSTKNLPSNISYLPSPLETSTFQLMISDQLKSSQKKQHTQLYIETTSMNPSERGGDEACIDAFTTPHQHQDTTSFSLNQQHCDSANSFGDENIQPKPHLSREEQLEMWKCERRKKHSQGNSSTRSNGTNGKSCYGTPSNNSSSCCDKSHSSNILVGSSIESVKSQQSSISNRNHNIMSQSATSLRPKLHPRTLPLTLHHDNTGSLSRPPITQQIIKNSNATQPRFSDGGFVTSLSRRQPDTGTSQIRQNSSNNSIHSNAYMTANYFESKQRMLQSNQPQLTQHRRQSLNIPFSPTTPIEPSTRTWSSLDCCGTFMQQQGEKKKQNSQLIVTKSVLTSRHSSSCLELSSQEKYSNVHHITGRRSHSGNDAILPRSNRRASVGTNPLDRLSTKIAAQRCMNDERERMNIVSPRQVIPEISFTPLSNALIVTSPLTCDNTIHKDSNLDTTPFFHIDDDEGDESSNDPTIGTESPPKERSQVATWFDETASVNPSIGDGNNLKNDVQERQQTQEQMLAIDPCELLSAQRTVTSEILAQEMDGSIGTQQAVFDVADDSPTFVNQVNTRAPNMAHSSFNDCPTDQGDATAYLYGKTKNPVTTLVNDHSECCDVDPPSVEESLEQTSDAIIGSNRITFVAMVDDPTRTRHSSTESNDSELIGIVASAQEEDPQQQMFPLNMTDEYEFIPLNTETNGEAEEHTTTLQLLPLLFQTENDEVNVAECNAIEIVLQHCETDIFREQSDKTLENFTDGSFSCEQKQIENCISQGNDIEGLVSKQGDLHIGFHTNDITNACHSPNLIAPTLSECTFQSGFDASLGSFEDGLIQVYQRNTEEDYSSGTTTNVGTCTLEDECPQLEQALQELEAFDWRSELISPVATMLPERRRTDAIELFMPGKESAIRKGFRHSEELSETFVLPSVETPVSNSTDESDFNWRQELESPLLKPRYKRRNDSSIVPIASKLESEAFESVHDKKTESINHIGLIGCIESVDVHSDPSLLLPNDGGVTRKVRNIETEYAEFDGGLKFRDSCILSPTANTGDTVADMEAAIPVARINGKAILYPIQEDTASTLSVDAYNHLLVENRKLQNQIYDLRKAHDDRIVPFREFLDEKRKLQVEKARLAEEQSDNEERLVITEQKMTAAVQLSIQKIKFLQAKLQESKHERDKISLELANAKRTIEYLSDELHKTKAN